MPINISLKILYIYIHIYNTYTYILQHPCKEFRFNLHAHAQTWLINFLYLSQVILKFIHSLKCFYAFTVKNVF